MNRKLMLFLAFVIVASFLCVSATDMTTKDFGFYTMDVPSDASFENSSFLPAGTPISIGSSLSTLSYSDDYVVEAEVDKKNNLRIFDFDFASGDGNKMIGSVEAYKNNIEDNGAVKQNASGDYDVYKFSDSSKYPYEIVVQDKGFLSMFPQEKIVVITGNDLDLLTQMADSVKFT